MDHCVHSNHGFSEGNNVEYVPFDPFNLLKNFWRDKKRPVLSAAPDSRDCESFVYKFLYYVCPKKPGSTGDQYFMWFIDEVSVKVAKILHIGLSTNQLFSVCGLE